MADTSIRNPFRTSVMRRTFDETVAAYRNRSKLLFNADGTRIRGNSWAENFWAGYDGITTGLYNFDRARSQCPIYALYRAGELIAASEAA